MQHAIQYVYMLALLLCLSSQAQAKQTVIGVADSGINITQDFKTFPLDNQTDGQSVIENWSDELSLNTVTRQS